MKHSIPIVFFLLLLAPGCGSTKFTRIGQRYPARERLCEFQVFLTPPAKGFVEIGFVDVKPGSYGANEFRDTEGLKRDIRLLVCEAGGDAVVAHRNAKGLYDKATVLKEVFEAPATAKASPAVATQPGCSFDAQCKGDRICVNGACVSPVVGGAPSK